MPYLAFNLNDGNEFVFDILEGRLCIGREASNDIVIDNTFISSFHAEFLRQPDGGYEIVDLKSANGTFVNGKRVERSRVKGGDRIMFGQLESRFRERAPKGFASEGGSKSVVVSKGQPSRDSGKKGDTESIPARGKGELAKSTPETDKIEVTKPVVQRAQADFPRPPGSSTPSGVLIPKPAAFSPPAPDSAASKTAVGLRDKVETLRQQGDSLRAENAVEQQRQDEIHSLDATLDIRKKELGQTQTEITSLKSELEKLRGQVQNAKTDASKLDAKRRDLSNTESKLESTLSLVAKAEEDLNTAQKSLQTLHAEADKEHKDREAVITRLVNEGTTAKKELAAINLLLATAQKSEAGLKSQRNAELQGLENDLAAKRAALEQTTAALAQASEETAAKATLAAKVATELAATNEKFGPLQRQLSVAEAKLKEITQHQSEAEKSATELTSKRRGELQALDTQCAAKTAELAKSQADLAKVRGDLTAQQAAAAEMKRLTAQQTDAQQSEAEQRTKRSAELQNLDQQLAARRAELDKTQADLAKAQSDLLKQTAETVKTREAAIAKLAADETTSAQKLAGLQQQISVADAELKRLSNLQADAQKSGVEQRTKHSADLQDIDKLLEGRRADLTKIEAKFETKQYEIEAVNASLAKAQEQVQHAQTQIAHLGKEETAITARVNELRGNEARLTALTQTLGQMESQRGVLDAAIGALLGRQQTHAAAASAAEQRMVTLRTQAAELEQQLAALDTQKSNAEAAFATQEKAALAKLAEIDRQAKDTRKLAETERLEAEKRRTELEAQVKELEAKAADLTHKLDDLVATDSKLKDTTDALKAVESHKAEVVAAVATLVKDRDERTRELLAATEHGRAQMLLSQALTQRREALEQEVHLIEEQKTELSLAMGKLREQVRVAETELKERGDKIVAAEKRTKNLEDLASTAEQQLKTLQLEHKKITEQLTLAKTDLEQAIAAVGEKHKEAAAAAVTAEKSSQQQFMLVEKISGLEAVIATLTSTHASTQQKLSAAESDHQNLQQRLTGRQQEIASAEARVADLTQQAAGLDDRVKELAVANKHNAELRGAITAATQERDKLLAETQRLTKERAELEAVLPDLRGNVTQARAEVDNLKAEMAGLIKDRDAATTTLKETLSQRKDADAVVEAQRIESVNLDKILSEKRTHLEAETKAKLAEANAAETRLKGVQERIAVAEKRLAELAEVDARIATASKTLKATETQRQAEEKTLAELTRNQDKLKKEAAALEAAMKTENARLAELTKAAKTNEAKALDAEKRAEKATAAQQVAEQKRTEADAAAEKARAEEKNLRKQIPTLTTELAGIQALLVTVTKEREEASQFVTRLNVSTDGQNKKLAELQQQVTQLEEAHKLREERVMKAQAEVDKETARLKTAQEQSRAAELQFGELEKEVKDAKVKADAAKKDAAAIEDELRQRLDRVQNLKADEERLLKVIETQTQLLTEVEGTHKDLHSKIEARQNELGDYVRNGGKILGLGQALAGLESRQTEINKSLRKAAEEDLAIQVKLNAAQEALNRESARAELARKDREAADIEFKKFSADIQKQAAVLQNYEMEQKKRIAELEKRIAELGTSQQRAVGQVDEAKAELVRLEGRKQEFVQAEAQLKQWQAIEKRLRGQLVELEEKHEIMRRGLPTEEGTVVMFSNDIIKRIDLIDALVARYAEANGSDVPQQLITLRASFEDILLQHGVSEFDVPPGMEVDIDLRKRITVVDSLPGKAKPRITECCRSGFIFSRGEGHEIILRKVEVRTSSQ